LRHRWVCGRVPARLPCRDTPLHSAAAKGKTDAVAELLVRFADFTIKRNSG
jgi:ankyrin repeat protein